MADSAHGDGEPFAVTQHGPGTLAAAATALTGEPAVVGQTHLAFLATLTPVTSAGIRFAMHSDGYVDSMSARCPACVRPLMQMEDTAVTVKVWMRLLAYPKANPFVAFLRNFLGSCRHCAARHRTAIYREITGGTHG